MRQPRQNESIRNIEFRVLTPAFYTRLVYYTYTSEALDRECVFTDERNRTFWMCRPQLLPLLLAPRSSLYIDEHDLKRVRRSYVDETRWRLLRRLRTAPPDPAYSVTPQGSHYNVADIRYRPYSELDQFVRSSFGHAHAGVYRRAVTQIFLAERFAFGFTGAIDLLDIVFRLALCYLGAAQLQSKEFTMNSTAFSSRNENIYLHGVSVVQQHWPELAWSVVSIFACQAYGMIKGYQ